MKLIKMCCWYTPNKLDSSYGVFVNFDEATSPIAMDLVEEMLIKSLQITDLEQSKSRKSMKSYSIKLFKMLNELAFDLKKSGGKSDLHQALRAMTAIYWLEKRGYLQPDDVNGCQFIRVEEQDSIARIGKVAVDTIVGD